MIIWWLMCRTENRKTKIQNLENGDLKGNYFDPPTLTPKVSMPVRYANPNDLNNLYTIYFLIRYS